jgi:hypothetical protein
VVYGEAAVRQEQEQVGEQEEDEEQGAPGRSCARVSRPGPAPGTSFLSRAAEGDSSPACAEGGCEYFCVHVCVRRELQWEKDNDK